MRDSPVSPTLVLFFTNVSTLTCFGSCESWGPRREKTFVIAGGWALDLSKSQTHGCHAVGGPLPVLLLPAIARLHSDSELRL